MKGKFESKTKKSGKKRSKKHSALPLWILGVLMLIFCLGVFLYFYGDDGVDADPGSDPVLSDSQPSNPSVSLDPADIIDASLEKAFDLGSGVTVDGLRDYTGAYMEDFSDEVVSDVLGILVSNQGTESIQYMEILLSDGTTTAEFVVSTLLPGQTMLVLEQNRIAYSTAPEFTSATTQNVAFFSEEPSLWEDSLEIQCLNGVLNVTNISETDIQGDIVIYYKNLVNGVYYGGVTYRTRIEGGLAAGEVRQGTASHFSPDNSAVLFVSQG